MNLFFSCLETFDLGLDAMWIPLIVGIDVLSAGLIALWITLSVRSAHKKTKTE